MENFKSTFLYHLPIQINIQIKHKKVTSTNKTYTNYRKADRDSFTKHVEESLLTSPLPDNIHQANKMITTLIL